MEGPPHPLFFTVAPFRAWRVSSAALFGGPTSQPLLRDGRGHNLLLFVAFQPLPQTDSRVFREAEGCIESLNIRVLAANLQIDFGTADQP